MCGTPGGGAGLTSRELEGRGNLHFALSGAEMGLKMSIGRPKSPYSSLFRLKGLDISQPGQPLF